MKDIKQILVALSKSRKLLTLVLRSGHTINGTITEINDSIVHIEVSAGELLDVYVVISEVVVVECLRSNPAYSYVEC